MEGLARIQEEMITINKISDMLHSRDLEMRELGLVLFNEKYPTSVLDGRWKISVPAGAVSILASRAYILGEKTAKLIKDEEDRKRLGIGNQDDSDDCISGQ